MSLQYEHVVQHGGLQRFVALLQQVDNLMIPGYVTTVVMLDSFVSFDIKAFVMAIDSLYFGTSLLEFTAEGSLKFAYHGFPNFVTLRPLGLAMDAVEVVRDHSPTRFLGVGRFFQPKSVFDLAGCRLQCDGRVVRAEQGIWTFGLGGRHKRGECSPALPIILVLFPPHY